MREERRRGLVGLAWLGAGLAAAVLLGGSLAEVAAEASPSCLQRVVVVSVVDKEGNPVSGLTAEDFRGEFRGQPVKIVAVEPESDAPRIVLLLDVSDSMREAKQMGLARMAAVDLITSVPGGQRMALLLVSGDVSKEVGFGENRALLLARLPRVEEELSGYPPGTALLDAILEALAVLGTSQAGDVIYVISDGGDNASKAGLRKVERALLESGVRLFGFLLPERVFVGRSPVPELRYEGYVVRELAEQSGGAVLTVEPEGLSHSIRLDEKDVEKLTVEASRMYRRMLRYYRVEVELAREVDKPRGWKLEVVDKRGKRRKDLKVIYPRKLVPCETDHERE